MKLVKHETCPQYVARRLSEGWRIFQQKGYHLVLSSPNGNILRPVDLRNDIETLRPDSPGDECNIPSYYGCSACPDHYDCVDEVDADDMSTYVSCDDSSYYRDLYNIANHSIGSGTINHIIVYARCRGNSDTPGAPGLKIAIKSDGTVTEDIEYLPTTAWVLYSKQWDVNPADSEAWEWADIDALQIGVALKWTNFAGFTNCTQMYVEVDYTPAPAVGRSFGYVMG